MAELTLVQERALWKLEAIWKSAFELQESIATLDALVRKGYAKKHVPRVGAMFCPRTAIQYKLV